MKESRAYRSKLERKSAIMSNIVGTEKNEQCFLIFTLLRINIIWSQFKDQYVVPMENGIQS